MNQDPARSPEPSWTADPQVKQMAAETEPARSLARVLVIALFAVAAVGLLVLTALSPKGEFARDCEQRGGKTTLVGKGLPFCAGADR